MSFIEQPTERQIAVWLLGRGTIVPVPPLAPGGWVGLGPPVSLSVPLLVRVGAAALAPASAKAILFQVLGLGLGKSLDPQRLADSVPARYTVIVQEGRL